MKKNIVNLSLRNKTRMATLTTFISKYYWNTQPKHLGKEKKRNPNQKERSKNAKKLSADDMIVYVENLKDHMHTESYQK